jgi:hypothetical protein
MLVLAPAVCCIAAVALSELMDTLTGSLKTSLGGSRGAALESQASGSLAVEAADEGTVAATPAKGKH